MHTQKYVKEKRVPGHSSAFVVIWDEKHLKALLGLRRHPLRLIQQEPWQSWIQQRGGVNHVRTSLRNNTISPHQRQLLDIILAHPDTSVPFYCNKLHISPTTYFVHLRDLTRSLLSELNSGRLEPVQEPSALLTNLPAPLTPLIGVKQALAAVIGILQRPGVRLLTLTGTGGVGKTRLAIDAGTHLQENFHDGVFFIPLETLNDPRLLTSQITRSLNLEKLGTQSLLEVLKTYLRKRQILLILDNFEQLIEGGALVTELLEAAAGLKVLATSREALNLYGEHRFTVPELTRPDPRNMPPLEQLDQWAAVNLFVQRVQAVHAAFTLTEANKQAVVNICHQLDGLPLAIELAAAQIKFLSTDQMLPHLERGLKSLRDNSRERPRQKTLWDAIDWSYQLLPEIEKTLFRRLAVFGREWSLEAAQIVCQATETLPGLEKLANKSLIRYAHNGDGNEPRFQMLQAVREYALDQLESSTEAEDAHRRHATYYLGLAGRAEQSIGNPQQPAWMERIKQEHENLQIALQWMLDNKETEMAFGLLGAVWRFWDMLNIWSETILWMDRALAQGAHLRSLGRAKTLWGASWLAAHQSGYTHALAFAEEGLQIARENDAKHLIGRLLQNVAEGHFRFGNSEQGILLIEESLQILRELNDQEEIAWALDHLARGLWLRGERAQSREILAESLAIFRGMGHQWAIAASLRHAGRLALDVDDNDFAIRVFTESMEISRRLGAKQRISEILRELALIQWKQNSFDQARQLLEEGLELSHEIGDRTGEGWALNWLGRLAVRRADFGLARQLFEGAQQLFEESGEPSAISSNLECFQQLELAENESKNEVG
jgi:predicted ATPase